MTSLTDIAIEHIYRGKKSAEPITFTLHPFENTTGEHVGRYEVLRDMTSGSTKQKRSAHLTKAELAEMYALGLHETYSIRLRLRPRRTAYPDAPPGKKVPSRCIIPGSDFERLVGAVDVTRAPSTGLREQMRRIGIAL